MREKFIPKNVLGILLAGGQSRRMGCDKAELNFAGTSQLQHAQILLREAGCNNIHISRNRADGIADIYKDQGPLAGLHAVLSRVVYPHNSLALIIPIDMPLLQSSHLKTLVQQANMQQRDTYFDDNYLPCVLHIDTHLQTELEQRLVQNQRSVKGFLLARRALILAKPDNEQFMNTNTPAEWQQACHIRQNSTSSNRSHYYGA